MLFLFILISLAFARSQDLHNTTVRSTSFIPQTTKPPPLSSEVSVILGAILVILGIIMITFIIVVCLKKRQSIYTRLATELP